MKKKRFNTNWIFVIIGVLWTINAFLFTAIHPDKDIRLACMFAGYFGIAWVFFAIRQMIKKGKEDMEKAQGNG